jgi:PhnB protein
MQINAHLNFDGTCEAAFRFYERCFGGKDLFIMKYGGSPMADQVGPDWQDKVVHARLMIGNTAVMGADAPASYYRQPQGLSITVGVETAAEAEHIFAALAEGGTVTMPLQQTFWAVRFGMVTDRFGIPWMVNCEQAT